MTGAVWIGPRDAKDRKNHYFRARKSFYLDEIGDSSALIVAAESSYILYLNGLEIGRGPARGTHSINFFDEYPVASELKIGRNDVGVLCHCMGIETFVAAPSEPAVLVEIPGILGTDETWEVSDGRAEWRSDVMLYTEQTGYSEWRDLRHEPVGWLTFADNAQWEPAACLDRSSDVLAKQFLPRAIPHLQESVHHPVGIPELASVPPIADIGNVGVARLMSEEAHRNYANSPSFDLSSLKSRGDARIEIIPEADGGGVAIIFDFGREVIGRFEVEVTASSGTIVDVGHEEQLIDGRLQLTHGGWKGERYDFADRYILREGRQHVGNSLMERGFRLVQIVIRNAAGPVTIHSVRAVDRRYPLLRNANFHCSDPLLEKIWASCVETISACTTDTFTDCPWRERALWVNDLVVEIRVFLQLSGDQRLPARTLQMAFSEPTASGLINAVCPCPLAGKKDDWLALPATNLFVVLILKDYLLYTGDVETVRGYLPKIARIFEAFARHCDDTGLVTFPDAYWNFFDWSYESHGRSLNGKTCAPLNHLHLIALKTFREILELTGESEAIRGLDARIARLSTVLNEQFFDPDTGRICDYIEDGSRSHLSSQLSHALAVLAGDPDSRIYQNLAKGVNDTDLLCPELYLHYFIFAAQKLTNQTENGLERIRKLWGNIISSGSPTIWEFGVHSPGKAALNGKGSLCHGFSTSPVDFFQTVILGISPLKPGFAEFAVAPRAFDLEFAEGCVPTPHGPIDIAWKRDSCGLRVALRVPDGCLAFLPDGKTLEPGSHHFVADLKLDHADDLSHTASSISLPN